MIWKVIVEAFFQCIVESQTVALLASKWDGDWSQNQVPCEATSVRSLAWRTERPTERTPWGREKSQGKHIWFHRTTNMTWNHRRTQAERKFTALNQSLLLKLPSLDCTYVMASGVSGHIDSCLPALPESVARARPLSGWMMIRWP